MTDKMALELFSTLDIDTFETTYAELLRISASVWANYGFVTSGSPNPAYPFDYLDEDGVAVWEDTDRYGDTNKTVILISAFPKYLQDDLTAERQAYVEREEARRVEHALALEKATETRERLFAEAQRREELRIYEKIRAEKEGR